MGNHFHILVRVFAEHQFADEEVLKCYVEFYGDERIFAEGLVASLREKLFSFSEFMPEIKVVFARFYNRRHNRRGYFWGGRFRYRTRYFTDSGIIGSKEFVEASGDCDSSDNLSRPHLGGTKCTACRLNGYA